MVLDSIRNRLRTSGPNPALEGGNGGWGWPFGAGIGSWRTDTWRLPTNVPAVTDASALSLTAFYRGVALIAGTVGGLPVQVFHEEIDAAGEEGKTVKLKTKDTTYLWRRPNPEMTMQSFWERVVGDEVRGNAFIFVTKNGRGQVVNEDDVEVGEQWGIWYIERSRVEVARTDKGVKVYLIDGEERAYFDYRLGGEIVHIPNWGGALLGYDPIKIAARAFALGLTAEDWALQAFSQGQVPPGILTTDTVLTPTQAEDLSKRWKQLHGGTTKSADIGVLGGGLKFQKVSNDLDEMQNEAARKLTVSDMARLLGLPPFLLADMDHASQGGGNGLEEQNRNLTTFNFNGHINRIQQAVSDDLLVRRKTNRYMRMNTAGLLRGNTLQRYQAYRLATFMTEDEKRVREELEPMGGTAAELLAMTNMVPIDDLGKQAMEAGQ